MNDNAPKEPGYYWMKPHKRWIVVEVTKYSEDPDVKGPMLVWFCGNEEPTSVQHWPEFEWGERIVREV